MRLAPEHDSSRADTKPHTLHPRDQEDASLTIHTAKVREDCIPVRTHREFPIALGRMHTRFFQRREVDVTAAVALVKVVQVGMMAPTVAEVRNLGQDVRLESLRAYAVSSDRKEGEAGRCTHHVHG